MGRTTNDGIIYLHSYEPKFVTNKGYGIVPNVKYEFDTYEELVDYFKVGTKANYLVIKFGCTKIEVEETIKIIQRFPSINMRIDK